MIVSKDNPMYKRFSSDRQLGNGWTDLFTKGKDLFSNLNTGGGSGGGIDPSSILSKFGGDGQDPFKMVKAIFQRKGERTKITVSPGDTFKDKFNNTIVIVDKGYDKDRGLGVEVNGKWWGHAAQALIGSDGRWYAKQIGGNDWYKVGAEIFVITGPNGKYQSYGDGKDDLRDWPEFAVSAIQQENNRQSAAQQPQYQPPQPQPQYRPIPPQPQYRPQAAQPVPGRGYSAPDTPPPQRNLDTPPPPSGDTSNNNGKKPNNAPLIIGGGLIGISLLYLFTQKK